MDQLPNEIISLIIGYLGPQTSRELGPYATISRAWQQNIEPFTLTAYSFTSSDWDAFLNHFKYIHRRQTLEYLVFAIELPKYEPHLDIEPGESRDSRDEIQDYINDAIFSDQVCKIFRHLASWHTRGRSMRFCIYAAHPYHNSFRDEYDESRERRNGALSLPLLRLNYRAFGSVPLLPRISEFGFGHIYRHWKAEWSPWPVLNYARYMEPVAAMEMLSKMPNVQEVALDLKDEEIWHPTVRQRRRLDLARSFSTFQSTALTSLTLQYRSPSALNPHHCNVPIATHPCSRPRDEFCLELHRLLRRLDGLTTFTLGGPATISSALFWPYNSSNQPTEAICPSLRTIKVQANMAASNGGFYLRDAIDNAGWWPRGWRDLSASTEDTFSSREEDCWGLPEDKRARHFNFRPMPKTLVPLIWAFAKFITRTIPTIELVERSQKVAHYNAELAFPYLPCSTTPLAFNFANVVCPSSLGFGTPAGEWLYTHGSYMKNEPADNQIVSILKNVGIQSGNKSESQVTLIGDFRSDEERQRQEEMDWAYYDDYAYYYDHSYDPEYVDGPNWFEPPNSPDSFVHPDGYTTEDGWDDEGEYDPWNDGYDPWIDGHDEWEAAYE